MDYRPAQGHASGRRIRDPPGGGKAQDTCPGSWGLDCHPHTAIKAAPLPRRDCLASTIHAEHGLSLRPSEGQVHAAALVLPGRSSPAAAAPPTTEKEGRCHRVNKSVCIPATLLCIQRAFCNF